MTPTEYDVLSNAFAVKNADLLRAIDSGDQVAIAAARTTCVSARAELDAAWFEVNGHDLTETVDILAEPTDVLEGTGG